MLDALERLLQVQELDLEIKNLEEEARALLPRVEQAERDMARRTEILKKLETEAAAPAEKRRKLEADLKEAESRVTRAKRQLTMVETNKQLEAGNHEMEMALAQVSALEGQILDLMDQEEVAATELASKREAGAKLDTRAKDERQRLKGILEEKRSMVKDLREDRIVAINRLDDEMRDNYERLLKLHHGPPTVAELRGGNACGGCGAVQVPQTVATIRQGNELVQCGHCFRYMYIRG